MKNFAFVAVSAVLVLGACTTDSMDKSAGMSKPAPTVVEPLIGKRLVGDNITFVMNADGTMGGTARDEDVVGVYKATAKESCSTYSAPEFLTGREYCSTPRISGNTVMSDRRDGSTSQEFKIEG